MFLYLGSIAAISAIVLAVSILDGDFGEGGLFAELGKRMARAKPLNNRSLKT